MMFTALKVLVSALAIGGINAIARSHPRLGGWIATLPIVSFFSVIWLAADGSSTADMASFVARVLIGQIPTAILLAILLAALSHGLPVPLAMLCAGVVWLVVSAVAKSIGLLG